jgi:hypothetical protein
MKKIELTKEELNQLMNGEDVLRIECNGLHITIKEKVEKWEPKFGEFTLSFNMQPVFVKDHVKSQENLKFLRESGMLRGTYGQAERAAKKMRAFNRLLAYVDEFDPEYEWRCGEDNYYIIVDSNTNKFEYDYDAFLYKTGMVYMSQKVAQEL